MSPTVNEWVRSASKRSSICRTMASPMGTIITAVAVLEIVAGRLIAPYVGVSLYTWTAVIGVILAGLSVGNWLGGVWADRGAGAGLRLGLVVLSTDETLEYEARGVLAGRDANLLHSRIPAQPHVTPEQLKTMEAALPHSAGLLPRGLDVIGYGCTSAATVIGPQEVAAAVQAVHPGAQVTEPISSVVAALDALEARRIALVTPYVASVTDPMRAHLARHGIDTVSEVSFGQRDDWTVARITEASTRAAMLEAGRAPGVQAVFASCTNLRTFGVIEAVEAELGVPVISSNQALIWDARYSLLTVALAGFGRAIAEVGAVIIVGGNIDHLTRVMTTAIALETSKGDLPLALALGIILLIIALTVNAMVMAVRLTAARHAYA